MSTRRTYAPMTYAEVLRLFRWGRYRFVRDQRSGARDQFVVVNERGQSLYVHTCHRGYRYVRFYHEGRRRYVSLHRLAWMLAHGRVVPAGYHLHHAGDKRSLDVDRLVLMLGEDHRAWHSAYAEEHEDGDEEALAEFLRN